MQEAAARRSLLSNRLEEKPAATLEAPPTTSDLFGEGHAHRHGHPGILSTQLQAHLSNYTNHRDSYRCHAHSHAQRTGRREEMLRRFLYSTFRQEVLEEQSAAAQEVKVACSMSHGDYTVEGFSPRTPQPSKSHHYSSEPPLSFWAENLHSITGVSPVTLQHAPFKRNSTFTTPTSQCLDLPELHIM